MDLEAAESQVSTLEAALNLGVTMTATYNGNRVRLAPHLIYRRHGVPHLAALNLTRMATRRNADRLSVFRVSGLTDLQLTPERSLLQPHLLKTIEHPRDQIIASIEQT